MLSIARALLLNPKLLMLDEPSQGLAPIIVQQVFDVIAAMRKEGMSVLLVEQNVRAAVEIADRAYVLDDGKVVYEGPAAEFATGRGTRARTGGRQRREVGDGGLTRIRSDGRSAQVTSKMSFHAAYDAAADHGSASSSPKPLLTRPSSRSTNDNAP